MGVCDDDEFSHGGDDGDDGFFAVVAEPFVEGVEVWVNCVHFAQRGLDLVPLLPSVCQRDPRISSESHALLFAIILGVPAPQRAAAWRDQQVETAGID